MLVPRNTQTIQWKYEGCRLTIDDGEFDYDLAALSVGEEHDEEQKNCLKVMPDKQTPEVKFHKEHQLDQLQLKQVERLKVFNKNEQNA